MAPDRDAVRIWLSPGRFEPYLRAANFNDASALQLYQWNSQVSSAFLEDLHYLEVALRNGIDNVLRPLEVDSRARREEYVGWWFNSETFLTPTSLTVLRESRNRLPEVDQHTRGKVLANTTFGFWEKLFGKAYDELWRKQLHRVFPNIPKASKRQTVSGALDELRKVRNRAAHHEPLHQLELGRLHLLIVDVCRWMNPELGDWVRANSRIPALLLARPVMPNKLAVIVPARDAWPLYEKLGVYICQSGRFFRDVNHIAFYAEGEIKADVARIQHKEDGIPWTAEEVGRRYALKTPMDKRVAEAIKGSLAAGWEPGATQMLFLLSRPGESDHEVLGAPLKNPRRGAGSGYVRKQRYAYVVDLKDAETTDDLAGVSFKEADTAFRSVES